MAATLLGEELETAYQSYTDKFRYIMAANYAASFLGYYDPENLDPLILSIWRLHLLFQAQYQTVSENFYQAFRQSETGSFEPVPFVKKESSYASVITSLMIHGPQAIQRKETLLGKAFTDFTATQQQESVNNVTQELVFRALEAPRDNLMTTMKEDPKVTRYIRKADSGACKFCRMLVSRGAVYLEKSSKFMAHGHCGCSGVPVYKGYKLPEADVQAANEWMAENKGLETKARRQDAVQEELDAGLKKKQVINYIDKYGREASRTTYVDTVKGMQVKAATSKAAQDKLDALTRTNQAYKEPVMSVTQKRSNESQASKLLEEMKNPLPR